ncbi:hypothetical protein BGLA2_210088 [Burkholderia gladioli]|nr:hypothetical protein BGLA2_210088 [Burkholderia gladioli]
MVRCSSRAFNCASIALTCLPAIAGESPKRRAAAARLPSSTAATNTARLVSRSISCSSFDSTIIDCRYAIANYRMKDSDLRWRHITEKEYLDGHRNQWRAHPRQAAGQRGTGAGVPALLRRLVADVGCGSYGVGGPLSNRRYRSSRLG